MQQVYSAELETIDWRYSAAAYGLKRYLDYHDFSYNKDEIEVEYGPRKEWDTIRFQVEQVNEESYLQFVQYIYRHDMHHKIIESLLSKTEFTDEEIKLVNEKLTANTILKKCFGKLKFDGRNKELILQIIEKNRNDIIKETFRNKKNLYSNFCNVNQLFNEEKAFCRLRGYYIDGPKKGKSVSYQFNPGTYQTKDSKYFDFIPFAFTIGRESVFINDNSSLKDLFYTNQMLQNKVNELREENGNIDVRKALFQSIIESAQYIDYDVEVILKDVDKDYFETLYLRKESIYILRKISNFKIFCFSHKINENYYFNVQREVTDCIMNMILLDETIEFFLKEESRLKDTGRFNYLIYELLKLNVLVRESYLNLDNEKKLKRGESMKQSMKVACACAGQVVKTLEGRNQVNKITSYRTKLTSAIVFKDYKRFCDILLQLANYCDVQFTFAYELFEDFEENKDLAYAFINALVVTRSREGKDK